MNKKLILIFIGIFSSTFLIAGDIEDIKDQMYSSLKFFNENKQAPNEYSKDGALEFWSSGGLMKDIVPGKSR